MRRNTVLALAAAVAAVLVPLYGDPRPSQVTHAEWARMLLRALDLDGALPASASDREVFSVLSWEESLSFAADRYLRADGVRVSRAAGIPRVEAGDAPGEVAYALAVLRGGDYRLRLRLAGEPTRPAAAEITRMGRTVPAASFSVPVLLESTWAEAGSVHLDPGLHTASVLVPPHGALEQLEVVPPCLNAIEPPAGWRAPDLVKTPDLAVTVLKAVDGEPELAPAAAPIEARGSDFQTLDGATVALPVSSATEGSWLLAGPRGRQAVLSVNLPEAGLYTVWVYGYLGGGQSWLADHCRKAILCPRTPPPPAAWSHLMTGDFLAGPHTFVVTLGPGAAVRALRVERKRNGPYDYAAAVARLGFEPGPAGVAPRPKVVEAERFVEARRLARVEVCGDIPPPVVLTAGDALAQPARLLQPQTPPGSVGTGVSPLAPSGPFAPAAAPTPIVAAPSPPVPILTPAPPPPPIDAEPPPPPPPTLPPPSPVPSPTLAPLGSPSPCQPPASPVTPNPCGP